MSRSEDVRLQILSLSVPGRLRMAAELVSAIPGLPENERIAVGREALSMIASAHDEISNAVHVLELKELSATAGRLLEQIAERRSS